MGIKERRQRERQQLRKAILTAAREIASSEGWQSVTIRKIAALIEYSPPVIYEYFDSKEDLLLELMRAGYAGQLEAVEKARDTAADPKEALLAMTRAWCRYAFDDSDLYQVMYGLGGVSFPMAELTKEGLKLADEMAAMLEKVLEENGKEAKDVFEKVEIAWATLHGLVSLTMAGRIAGGAGEAERLVDQAIRDYLVAWTQT